jgi:hypothetical protein
MAKNGFSMSNRIAVETVTADKTLTKDDCGKVFIVQTATNAAQVDITLPGHVSAGEGWNVELIMESGSSPTPNQALVITGSGDVHDLIASPFAVNILAQGPMALATYAAPVIGSCGKLTYAAASQTDGDRIKIVNASGSKDGWRWYTSGVTSGSVTLGH